MKNKTHGNNIWIEEMMCIWNYVKKVQYDYWENTQNKGKFERLQCYNTNKFVLLNQILCFFLKHYHMHFVTSIQIP